ncbi:MAG: twin-arginine translocase subunit TatC [Prevotellaceae bacterium]|jgi:sec-independent protein translocase protein TatC|nr:twin-arginine translocase subunit TatC [Prevotellaceae bacterium]
MNEKEEEEKKHTGDAKEMSFWEHLDELRGTIFRIAGGIIVCMILVFANRHLIFDVIIFGPTSSDFILYRGLNWLAKVWNISSLNIEYFKLNFQNVTVSGQFFTHINTSFWFGLVLSFPWIIFQLWRFVSPALYDNERKAATRAFSFSSLLFFTGVAVAYFMVIPLSVKFLGTYYVAENVENIITIASYIDMFVLLAISMGLIFQLPILIMMLSRIGIVRRRMLNKYRRHAIVGIVTLAAIVTPTADPFTMLVVSMPVWLLYEFSIYLCKK